MTSQPDTAPDFLLSRSHGSVRTQGTVRTYTDPYEGSAALKRAEIPMVVGAIPFSTEEPSALRVPRTITHTLGPLEPPASYRIGSLPPAYIVAEHPCEQEHRQKVAAAIATINATPVDKIVLARSLDVAFAEKVDPHAIVAKLITLSPDHNAFLTDITPPHIDAPRQWLIGSSPEVLIKREGATVSCYPLAGSTPRHHDPRIDKEQAHALLHDTKNLHEHAFVVEHIKKILSPLCHSLSIPTTPHLTSTAEMWHLATPIKGILFDPEHTNALDLALLLHPTPAICGTPAHLALTVITEAEVIPRHYYAGTVGWCNSAGDGEFMVTIRCAETDGYHLRTWAGGGLVADSDPDDEVAETTAKLRTILRALNCVP